jgi:predicted nucleic acid-binding protein
MTVTVDAGILGLLLHPDAKIPNDPQTGKPVEQAKERIEQLIDDLDNARERIIIPTPALSEFLVLAGADAPQYLGEISLMSHVRVEAFDQLAAIELAAIEGAAHKTGNKRHPLVASVPWQKVKLDRQIVAVAKLHQSRAIYSDDAHIRSIAEDLGIRVASSWELPLPASKTPLFDDSGPPLEQN